MELKYGKQTRKEWGWCIRGGVFSDNNGFVVYTKPLKSVGDKKTVEFTRFDYQGKVVESGREKYEEAVIAPIQSDNGLWLVLKSTTNNWLSTYFLQKIDPKNLKPLSESQKIDLPKKKYDLGLGHVMGKVKGTVAVYWTLAGYDEKHLLFYGKKTDATAGKTQFEFVKTDYFGKKVDEFNVEVTLENGKYVNRTLVQKNIDEGSEAYFTSSQYAAQTLDPGNYGACYVDFATNVLYIYGCYDNEPDYAQTKPEGYFIQQFSLSGKNIWRYQTKDNVIDQGKKYEP